MISPPDAPFLNHLEARLATLTGRDRWPTVEARTSSKNVPANLRTYDAFISLLPFVWTVNGKSYVAILRASSLRPEALLAARHATMIQHHPTHPARFYYAPRQLYARSLLAIALVVLISGGTALTVLWSVR